MYGKVGYWILYFFVVFYKQSAYVLLNTRK